MPGETGAPFHPEAPATDATGRGILTHRRELRNESVNASAPVFLPHGLKAIDFDPFSDKCCELLGLVIGEVEMILGVVLPDGETDREPAVTSGEAHIALGECALGMGSGEFCHDTLRN